LTAFAWAQHVRLMAANQAVDQLTREAFRDGAIGTSGIGQ
jgi:hypothetical protein